MANIFRRQKIDVEELQKKLEKKEEELLSLNEMKRELILDLNAIHLYAALSEEETQVQTLKEKQKMIMDICEKIMKDYMIS